MNSIFYFFNIVYYLFSLYLAVADTAFVVVLMQTVAICMNKCALHLRWCWQDWCLRYMTHEIRNMSLRSFMFGLVSYKKCICSLFTTLWIQHPVFMVLLLTWERYIVLFSSYKKAQYGCVYKVKNVIFIATVWDSNPEGYLCWISLPFDFCCSLQCSTLLRT